MKIENAHISKLADVIKKKKDEGNVLVSFTGIDGLLEAMGIDNRMKNYIDVDEFVQSIRVHKMLEWNNLTFIVKDNVVYFFEYICKH